MIELEGISKKYGDTRALEDITLRIEKGEIFTIVGHSGAGKTTLLRILALLEKPDSGKYYYKGKIADNNCRREITMVFQKPVMFNSSVYSNVAYGLRIRKSRKIEDRVRTALKLVNLEGFEKYNAKRLSGGEQQRVAIARAIAIEPEVLIMDEPTANLDLVNAAIVEKVITEIAKKGTTVVLATHNLFQAKRLSDRIAHIFGGRVVEVSKTEEFFERPKSEISRRFVTGELQY
ncbi:ABC transporter ATP-binding protein [Archaeoglobus neptunius]|uniref:ABC transporter ATP-binding protein n=1 Tax=Archaeoglobus neptunius TaxID=2798580 RepID=UPI0019279BEC